MDFICACLLVFFWYVRPQDIFAVISGVSVVKYAMYVGIIATLRRAGGFSRAIVWAVPIDWLVTAYCLWAIYATADHTGAFKEVFTYFSFHMVTALALNSWAKIEKYLNIWLGCLAVLAVLAVSSHWDVELVKGSAELTMAFHDRLTLNTWVFRNPNALGHGVVTLIPAAMAWWVMAGGKNKMLGFALIALAIHCVLLTESKGAFLAGAGGLTMLFLFKRPVWLQLVLLALVYGLGIAALKSLPRMDTLSKDDEGIQGRMIVWQQAKFSMESTVTGEGLKTFQGYVSIRNGKLHRTVYIQIATHGSYVRHGADLGYMGLLLFAGIFYGGVRVLLVAQTVPGSEALRVQRTLYALIATTVFSSWVVDRAYHMDFYLLSGVISAFHRRFLPGNKGQEEDGGETEALAGPESKPPLLLPATAGVAPADEQHSEALAGTSRQYTEDEEAENTPDQFGAIKLKWSRIGVVDMMIMYLILEVLLYYWELFSTDFVVF